MILDICFWNEDIPGEVEFHLKFKIEKHPIAILWVKKLQSCLSKRLSLRPRYTRIFHERSREFLISKIKDAISIINSSWINTKYGYEIENISDEYTLKDHNSIHLHFEKIMGPSWNHSEMWKEALELRDERVMSAIRSLNYLTHEIIETNMGPPQIIISFSGDHVTLDHLPKEADNYFTLETNTFGDIYLNYAQIGKAWVDHIIDCEQEHNLHHDRILPLQILTGEFDICLGDLIIDGKKVSHNDFFRWLKPRLEALGKDPYDKSLRLGKIKVASLLRSKLNKWQILEEIRKRKHIWSIGIIDNEKKLFSQDDITYQEFEPYYNLF